MHRQSWTNLSLWSARLVSVGLAGFGISAAAFELLAGGERRIATMALASLWAAALLAALIHVIAQRLDPVERYLARHEPLAGPRPGSELPG